MEAAAQHYICCFTVFIQYGNRSLFCVNAKHTLTLLTGTAAAGHSRFLEVCEKRKHKRSQRTVEANWEKSFLKQSIFLLLKWFFFRGVFLSCLHNN